MLAALLIPVIGYRIAARPATVAESAAVGRLGMNASHARIARRQLLVWATMTLTAIGIEAPIPDSTFIEQNVTDWTSSSQSVRVAVKGGVA